MSLISMKQAISSVSLISISYLDNLFSAVNCGFGPHHIKGALTLLTIMSRECSRFNPSYQRHITFAGTGCYQLHPHYRLGIITPDLSPVPIYRPQKDE